MRIEAVAGDVFSSFACSSPVRDHSLRGPPFPEVEVKTVTDGRDLSPDEIGEIAIRSTANSQGYFDNPEATQRLFINDGYLLSGDLGYIDEDGYLYIVSRKKNIIKRAGDHLASGS